MKRSTVLDKIVVAIGALNTPGGCSRQAIAKGVGGDVTAAAALKAALARGVASGVLVQVCVGSCDVMCARVRVCVGPCDVLWRDMILCVRVCEGGHVMCCDVM